MPGLDSPHLHCEVMDEHHGGAGGDPAWGFMLVIIETYYVLWLLERVYYYYFGLFLIESCIQGWRKDEEELAG